MACRRNMGMPDEGSGTARITTFHVHRRFNRPTSISKAKRAAYAATDPAGKWSEDWAKVWTDTGAGQKLPAAHLLAAERATVDQAVLTNLLLMNQARSTKSQK